MKRDRRNRGGGREAKERAIGAGRDKTVGYRGKWSDVIGDCHGERENRRTKQNNYRGIERKAGELRKKRDS